jgi:hypothetical protein
MNMSPYWFLCVQFNPIECINTIHQTIITQIDHGSIGYEMGKKRLILERIEILCFRIIL